MNSIAELPFCSTDSCKYFAQRVLDLRQFWTKRAGVFWTLGAAIYLDPQERYYRIAEETEVILRTNFHPLYKKLQGFVYSTANQNVEYRKPWALPGFHIFGKECNGIQGSIHTDTPYINYDWGSPVVGAGTYTVPLALPKRGGGLNYWQDGEKKYQPYKLGKLYLHSGDFQHQIANDVLIDPDEYRITFQGHYVVLAEPDKYVTVLYF